MSRPPDRRTIARLVALLLATGLAAGASSAPALERAHGDPQKRLTSEENARARAMLPRKADLGAGFAASRSSSEDNHLYCRALDESDLTVTGEAESPNFERGLVLVAATASLYESSADARESWRRGTSPAGERCAENVLRNLFAQQRLGLESMSRLAFPRVSQRTVAYRVRLTATSQGTTVPYVLDLVVLMRARAQVSLLFGSGLAAVPKADEVRLARLVASRMRTELRRP